MITSGYERSAPDTPHPPTPAAQLQPAAISGTSSRIGAVPVPANGHTTSPHKRCAQAPTPINFDHPLMWELSAIDNQRRWSTTLLVLPPLPADELRRRWTQFVPLLNNMSMTGHSLPAEPGQVLVATASTTSGWTVMTATRRNEWTYRAALIAAADRGC